MSFEAIRNSDIVKYIDKPNVLIIDLRDKDEFDIGHIPGAVNIPYDELEDQVKNLSLNSLLVFYCDRGNISLMAVRDLEKYGYQMKSLHGGIHGYHGRLEKSR
jgi:rhodanese-related sulfurtransferase